MRLMLSVPDLALNRWKVDLLQLAQNRFRPEMGIGFYAESAPAGPRRLMGEVIRDPLALFGDEVFAAGGADTVARLAARDLAYGDDASIRAKTERQSDSEAGEGAVIRTVKVCGHCGEWTAFRAFGQSVPAGRTTGSDAGRCEGDRIGDRPPYPIWNLHV
ncbi:hypothetical protein [Brevundimonas aurifodinae]|uniref:Uncharacterized protein n=1 Tax=Brevundimonas aurifodinae TaxID=1508312 RepID=A0ABV1NKC6_9CAUL